MKKFFVGIVALTLAASFTSCQQDAPEINFVHNTTHTSDFSGIIKALTDMSTSIDQKLDLINQALKDQKLSFEQKMAILTTAVENGILTQKEQMEKLIAAIASMDNKLAALTTAIESQTLSFEQKMDLLNQAVEKGFADNKTAIDLLNTVFSQKMTDMITTSTVNTETLKAAIEALNSNNGIYRLPNQDAVYMNPDVWEVVKQSPELSNTILTTLTPTEPTVTTSQVSSHSCVIARTKIASGDPKLIPSWNNTDIVVGGVNQELVKVINMFTSATYAIDKGSCALGCYEINITDARGTGIQQYNFNGAAGGNVVLQFYNDSTGILSTTGHIEVVMR